MRVKVELELVVTTDYTEIEGCTKENFQEHVRFVLADNLVSDNNVGDLDYVSCISSITFPDGE